jgi:copper chaperone CopZ
MEMRRITMHIDGMTCAACEARVRKALLGVPGVAEAGATLRGGKASVVFDPGATNETALAAAVVASGYAISSGREATWTALGIGAALSALYLFLSAKGIFNSIPSIDTSIGFGMLFAIGLLTSIHCVSMCGGIALSQSLGRSEKSV